MTKVAYSTYPVHASTKRRHLHMYQTPIAAKTIPMYADQAFPSPSYRDSRGGTDSERQRLDEMIRNETQGKEAGLCKLSWEFDGFYVEF